MGITIDVDTVVLIAMLTALLGMLWFLVCWDGWSPDLTRPADGGTFEPFAT